MKLDQYKEKIIVLANKIAKRQFMDFTDYDPDDPMTDIESALTAIIFSAADNDDEINTDELYLYFKSNVTFKN